MEQKTELKQWAIVALFGHTKLAGQVSEHNLGGTFLRLDVPPVHGRPGFTKLIGHSAIFDITFVTEEIARAAANSFRAEPVSPYEIPELRQLRLGIDRPDLGEGHPDLDSSCGP